MWLQKRFGSYRNFGSKKIFASKKNFASKKFCVKIKFLVWKKIWSKINFGSKKILGQKKIWAWKKNFGPKKISALKKFESENILGPKKFVVVLVLLVTWTHKPLNSARSPWVVYASNFSLLVHSPLINFGEGCSCCSCSCYRGKTKSTQLSVDSDLSGH